MVLNLPSESKRGYESTFPAADKRAPAGQECNTAWIPSAERCCLTHRTADGIKADRTKMSKRSSLPDPGLHPRDRTWAKEPQPLLATSTGQTRRSWLALFPVFFYREGKKR